MNPNEERITTFALRLAQALTQRRMRQVELCARTGIPKSAMSQYLSGRIEPKAPRTAALAQALEVSEAWLCGYNVPMTRGAKFPALPEGAFPVRTGRRIPILGRVAAGLPLYAEENIEGYLYQEDAATGEEYFALRVQGDSMTAAGICDGDVVVVRQQNVVDDNDVAVVCVNGNEATVKRFHRSENLVMLSPQSYNPVHQTQIYNLKEIPIHIYGKVVEVRHRM